MRIVTCTYARNTLKNVLDDVVQDADVTIISGRDAEGDAVVMSLDHYNSFMETLHAKCWDSERHTRYSSG
jgi:antitoxin YefM